MTLREELDSYLAARRSLGYRLARSEYLLGQFCGWLAARGQPGTFTIDDAVAWAREPATAQPVWWSQRLTVLRPFAAYLNACGADVPVIPRALLPAVTTRATPFIYSQADLDALTGACPAVFTSARVAATMRVIIGLLAATGIRIGEAVHLTVPDFDAANDVILVRGRKTPLDRLVPRRPDNHGRAGRLPCHARAPVDASRPGRPGLRQLQGRRLQDRDDRAALQAGDPGRRTRTSRPCPPPAS